MVEAVDGKLAIHQLLVAEAKTDLAFVSPTAAIRVAHEAAAQHNKAVARRTLSGLDGIRSSGVAEPTPASALSGEDAEAFEVYP